MEKIVVCIMGQNCEKFLPMCLESVKDADAIVYCDGGSTDNTIEIVGDKKYSHEFLKEKKELKISDNKIMIYNEYNQEDKKQNGKQRKFYLKYLQENYKGWWALCLDADEVVEDFSKVRDLINKCKNSQAENLLFSPRMRHFIGTLGTEDAIQPVHYVLNRLFKVRDGLNYPEVEHPVLQGGGSVPVFQPVIWHLSYIPNMWEIKRKYENHLKKSNMHTPEYLRNWYKSHLFGQYPTKPVNPEEIPAVILKEFGIDPDEVYFDHRGVELKHAIMVRQWIEYFKPESITDVGCGRGPFLYFMRWFVPASGMEISKYAIEKAVCAGINQGDITKDIPEQADLITAIDLLEHIDYKEIDQAIDNLIQAGKRFLISVPVLGDPNLEADKTHKIKEERNWWVKKFTSRGLKEIEVPNDFLFRNQLMIFTK
jgi:glycosyltransferase involved in cell wall biosynthesis